VKIHFGNTGKAAAVYQVYSGDGQSGTMDLYRGPNAETFDTWDITRNAAKPNTIFQSFGPNGFLRVFEGSISESRETQSGEQHCL